ncbi:PQQ-dependent sugar dehydrogenase [Pontibacter anaerobius]|uniref:PQQ-dependent sugar dehydrogenase n=1 Tax=Pontibacter anaerobius TaxID=2993940 RepID=A0ABT3RD86_9BACT|nr:PQQ-dependent sugar dehydrogenase [Pontibacter anaerobius]MCX2739512.1 PQQ-dependent sugar dehydrogenase [Pontibacter anaerobius]
MLPFVLASCDHASQGKEQQSPPHDAYANVAPEENRFTVEELETKLYEPMQLAVMPGGEVLYIERRGVLRLYDPAKNATRTIGEINVFKEHEDGLLGLAIDPHFEKNKWIYLFYSPAGDEPVQRVSRFTLEQNSLNLSSERVILRIPVERQCCHSAGSLEFGADGNLYIGVGDNSTSFESDGYAPIDERPGKLINDAQRTAANTNDLRGKILRIRPLPDGTYSIPDGNLFPKNGSEGRPEIYTMGNRNPFRVSVDAKTGYVYWGEVGPDAGKDNELRGPKGYDEVNQAKKPGNFGWPHFVADNKPYRIFDFRNNASGGPFVAEAPVNKSPNNTGKQALPPAQKAMIYYPYDESPEFPMVGDGGRNAMAGPVFYRDHFSANTQTFPGYFDGKLFIYDWMREWVMTVNVQDDTIKLERFLPSTHFAHPIDMEFGPDGALYVLEYGTYWHANNDDSKLIRIQFHPNNRKPVARASANKVAGAVPLTVSFSSEGTMDYDAGDEVRYAWTFEGEQVQSRESAPSYTFTKPGIYQVKLTVKDKEGYSDEVKLEVQAGNEPPLVSIRTDNNRSFYWDNHSFRYEVTVEDREDGTIVAGAAQENDVKVSFDYLAEGYDLVQTALGQDLRGIKANLKGKTLVEGSDCKSCHALNSKSVGPSYLEVARRYKGKNSQAALAAKIMKGGSGNWGEIPMAAHPQLSQEEAKEMVEYILGLAETKGDLELLPLKGRLATDRHKGKEGTYFLTASYTDKGNKGMAPITARQVLTWRHPEVDPSTCDESRGVMIRRDIGHVRFTENRSHIVFRGVDLTGVAGYSVLVVPTQVNAVLELHTGSPSGPIISKTAIPASLKVGSYDTGVTPTEGIHNLYFVLRADRKEEIGIWNTLDISKVSFRREAMHQKVQPVNRALK